MTTEQTSSQDNIPAPTMTLSAEPAQPLLASSPTNTTAAHLPEPTPVPEPSVPSAAPATITANAGTATQVEAKPQPGQAPSLAKPTAVPTDVPAAIASEIQNPLTKKFTEAEWKSLFEFRAQLPDILAEAFPDNSKARETPISIWGISIDPTSPQKDARVSVVLMKFLRARNLNVSEARDMFVNTLRWRESFDIPAALEEKCPEDVFGGLGYVSGHDKEGRPVTYNIYGGNQDLKAVFGDVKRFIRWRVALMERSVLLLDFNEIDQMLQVHDYHGVSLTSRDANSKAAAAEATNIFQSHYPELLYKKFFINIPTLLNWIFWIFKPLISANTLAKMSVIGTGQNAIKAALLPHIDASQLPERYGGQAKDA
ncbi:hypothetical protein D9613_006924 [Agrocybe pediades]|uniref:Phosphatidylinositol transfer protein SFH5 n=1 Tax=Agrocybe pediades TaxID=84607 RepID=A0A8H4QGL9_9AGAR|nr:hypothetical protein D9613_006924 [Agrocybe pediades]